MDLDQYSLFYNNDDYCSELPSLPVECELDYLNYILDNYESTTSPISNDGNQKICKSPGYSTTTSKSESLTDFNPDDFFANSMDGDISIPLRVYSPSLSSSSTDSLQNSIYSYTAPQVQSQQPLNLPAAPPAQQTPSNCTTVLIQQPLIPITTGIPISFKTIQSTTYPQVFQQTTQNSVICNNNLMDLIAKQSLPQNGTNVLPRISIPTNQSHTLDTLSKINGFVDEKVLKKQKRMIKNRQSASLSRKKNKDYVQSLECKIGHLEEENSVLKKENSTLRSQLIGFSQSCQCRHSKIKKFVSDKISNSKIGNRVSSKTKINSVLLLAMVFMVSLNVSYLKNLVRTDFESVELSRGDQFPESQSDLHLPNGRRLLWYQQDENVINGTVQEGPANYHEFNKINNKTISSSQGNQAENLRLASELQKLIGVNTFLNISSPVNIPTGYISTKSKLRKSFKSSADEQRLKSSIQIFGPQLKDEYTNFFNTINHRDDTFYVVSFNIDHILRPASAYNQSFRPKVALMLPAGDGSTTDMFSLMQIDCEVTMTKLVNFTKSAIPRNFRKTNLKQTKRTTPITKSNEQFNSRNVSSINSRRQPSLLGDVHNENEFYRPLFLTTRKLKNITEHQQNIEHVHSKVRFLKLT